MAQQQEEEQDSIIKYWEARRLQIKKEHGFQHVTESIYVDPVPFFETDTAPSNWRPKQLILEPQDHEHWKWRVVANENINKYDFVDEVVGEIINEERYVARQTPWNLTLELCRIMPSVEHFISFTKTGHAPSYFSVEFDMTVDFSVIGNNMCFLNHSCKPNCVAVGWIRNNKPTLVVMAVRDITKGQQLTLDYYNPKTELYKQDLGYGPCICGSDVCRYVEN